MIAHFFDIETILINNSKIWIIDKLRPNNPIIRISQSDFNLIRSGIYKSQNNLVEFSGDDYWLPTDLIERLKIKCKNLNTDFSNLAFSLQEFLNKEIIENTTYELNLDSIQHLKNKSDHIYVICSKNTKRNYELIIKKIESKLEEIGLKIEKYFFISETFYDQDSDNIAFNKIKLILQHTIGLKSNIDRFLDEKITKYNQIHFYDNDPNTIKLGIKSNDFLKYMLSLSDELLKKKIIEILRNEDNILYIHQVNSNRVNILTTTKIELEYSKIIKTFEAFRFRN